MNLLTALLLGLTQGITEWLPVSSSGHLAIIQHFFNIKENIAYDTLLHFATVIVIFVVFRKKILEIAKTPRYWLLIIIGTIPIIIIGLLIRPYIQSIFNNLMIVGISLIFTSIMLYFSDKPKTRYDIKPRSALIIGLFQALAILPGISRSGSTITAALYLGIKKDEAIDFAFILAVPAILGATILNIPDITGTLNMNMVLGSVLCIIVSYFSLTWLIKIIKNNKLKYFSYYCFALGLVTIIFS